MAGARTKDITGSQTLFLPELVLLVDRIDTGSGDWAQARKLELSVLGNTYYQGSSNGINWHNEILATDTYLRVSTDGGTTWLNLDTNVIQEASNLYFTEARVLATPGVQTAVDNAHTHANKALLDNLISNGGGNAYLADDGTYKAPSELIPGNILHSSLQNLDYASSGHTGFEPARIADQNYVTDAQLVVIQNTSNTNTGDETQASIKSKLGITTLSGSNTGDQIAIDVPISDAGGLYIATEVEGALAEVKAIADDNATKVSTGTTGQSITLPSDTTVAGRIAGAIEGTDYPTGWVLTAGSNPVDIDINHGTGKRVKEVTIFSVNGTEERILLGNAAWSGFLTPDANNLRIESLATINTTIKIYITFD